MPMKSRLSLDVHADDRLTYDGQLQFKRAWCRKYLKDDCFYFDYVTGVDAKTSHDIPGLIADGSLTWRQASSILCKHFGIKELANA